LAGLLPQIVFDSKPLSNFLSNFEVAIPVANALALSKMRMTIPNIIREVLILTMDATDFPDIYRGHLLACSRSIPVSYINAGGYIEVLVDIEALGTSSDLREGYHRLALEGELGASHRGPKSRVHLPYMDQNLYNKDREKRASFWEAIVNRTPYDVGKDSINSAKLRIQTAGMYDETLINRVTVWGNKAPEWLILQWGSADSGKGEPPQTKPQPLIEDLRELIGVTCSNIYVASIQEAIANIPREAGAGKFTMNGQVFDKINGSAFDLRHRFSKAY
jgi:hypothetical protein